MVEEFGRKALTLLEGGHSLRDLPFQLRAKNGEIKYVVVDSNTCYNPDGTFNHSRCYVRNDHERIVREAVIREGLEKYRQMAAEKDRFIRCTFHQIRTPLHALVTSFALATNKLLQSTDREVRELRSQLDGCLGLVDDLALATMFDSDNVLQPHPVRLRLKREIERMFQQATHHFAADAVEEAFAAEGQPGEESTTASEKQKAATLFDLNYDVTAPRNVSVDPTILRVLHNLFDNALKFRSNGSKVAVSVDYQPVAALPVETPNSAHPGAVDTTPQPPALGSFKFTITNQVDRQMDLVQVHRAFQSYSAAFSIPPSISSGGSNIGQSDPANLEQEVSQRLADTLISNEGLGLGLYVAYNIVQSLGGLLECSASPAESAFWFTLNMEVFPDSSPRSAKVDLSSAELMEPESPRLPEPEPEPDDTAPSKPATTPRRMESWHQVSHSELGSKHVTDGPDRNRTDSKSSGEVSTPETPPVPLAKIPAAENINLKKPRILIVDDSPICRKVLMKSLQAHGYDTDLACDGQEACDKLLFEPCLYDAVLMDLRMPIMDGLTATRICKQRHHLAQVPIIIVTAELGEEIRAAAMSAQASHFIGKPAKIAELTETLQRFINPTAAGHK